MPYPVRVIPGSEAAVETLGLRKAYRSVRGRVVGIDGLDLRVPAGGVHALLGLPESGKTTTLRLLTGLARADGGAIKIFGVPVPDGLPDLAGRIGAVVGEPGFQAGLSGRSNLALLAGAAGVPRTRVDEVLTRVVLADRGKAAYDTYSADERRRLALAAALLRDPDLLVVDEPSDGLDAVGTREIRQALRRLADQGKTVLVATGVLTEAQQIADTVTVLDGGRVLAQGRAADLLGDAKVTVRLRLDEPAKAITALRAAGFAVRADGETLHVDDVGEPADISRALAKQKLYASELTPQREDLSAVVGRLRPVAPPTPEPLSRAEERAARKAVQQQAAERQKAAERRKAEKEAAAAQKAAAVAAEKVAVERAATEKAAAEKVAAVPAADKAAAKKVAAGARVASAPKSDTKAGPDLTTPPEADTAPRQSKREQRRAAFDAEVAARQAAAAARIAERQEAADAKAAAKEAAAAARAAAKQAATDERAARKQEAAEARATRSAARKEGVLGLLGRRASDTSGGQASGGQASGGQAEPGAERAGSSTQGAAKADARPKGSKPEASLPDGARASTPKSGSPRPGTPQPEAPKPGAPKSGAPKPGTPKPGAPKPGAPTSGAPAPGAAKQDRSKQNAPHPGRQHTKGNR